MLTLLTVSQHAKIFIKALKCQQSVGIGSVRQHSRVIGKLSEIFGSGWDIFGNNGHDETHFTPGISLAFKDTSID